MEIVVRDRVEDDPASDDNGVEVEDDGDEGPACRLAALEEDEEGPAYVGGLPDIRCARPRW